VQPSLIWSCTHPPDYFFINGEMAERSKAPA
jgi:hypothetical protein